MLELGVHFLGWEDPLEEEVAIYSSILAGTIPWTEESSGLQSTGLERVRHDLVTKQDLSTTDEQSANPQAEV